MEDISPHHPQKIPEDLKAYAREMRKKMPDAEQLLWYLLRNRRVAGAKFRRQHPVGRYILDFYCVEKKLAIELDGSQHSQQKTYDQHRDAYLKLQGIEVLRFWNNQMLLETEAVLESIYLNLVGNNLSTASGEFQMLGRGEGGQVTAQCFSKRVIENMNIIYYAAGANPEVWLNAFHRYLPDAKIRIWEEGDTAPADYALVWKPPAAMLRGRTDLKAIFNLGAGVDAILQLGDNLPQGVPLIRVDDAGMGVQMAEYVSHAVLRHFRRFDEYDALQADTQWRPLPPHRKEDFSIGILGLGVLGHCIIEGLRSFGFPLLGWSRSAKQIEGVQCFHGDDGLDAFLSQTKVLVLILPLTKETENLMESAKLAKLKQGAYIVNVARGAHIVEDDLLTLIQQGHIAGATLDVFREEPLPPTHPFWNEKRIHITPHISALTVREESAKQIANKIAALQRGESVVGVVDQSKGY